MSARRTDGGTTCRLPSPMGALHGRPSVPWHHGYRRTLSLGSFGRQLRPHSRHGLFPAESESGELGRPAKPHRHTPPYVRTSAPESLPSAPLFPGPPPLPLHRGLETTGSTLLARNHANLLRVLRPLAAHHRPSSPDRVPQGEAGWWERGEAPPTKNSDFPVHHWTFPGIPVYSRDAPDRATPVRRGKRATG